MLIVIVSCWLLLSSYAWVVTEIGGSSGIGIYIHTFYSANDKTCLWLYTTNSTKADRINK